MTPSEFRAQRVALGLSQRDLAAWLDVRQATLSRIESGAQPVPDGIADEMVELERTVAFMAELWRSQPWLAERVEQAEVPAACHLRAVRRALEVAG